MPAPIVVARTSATVFIDAQRVHIREGSAWAADSPAVKLNPAMFSDDPAHALGLDLIPPASRKQRPVERKTAAPGEKSNARRP